MSRHEVEKTDKLDSRGVSRPVGPTIRHLRIAIWIGLAVLTILVLLPHLQTGFTTKDDTEFSLIAANDHWLSSAASMATSQARFYQIVSMSLMFAVFRSYLVDPALFHLIYLGSFLINIGLFYVVVRMSFRSKIAALLAAVFAISYLQNSWYHSLLTSYPVIPHLAFSSFLCVLICLLKWQRGGLQRYAVLAALALFFSLLIYEAFLAYLPILLALVLHRASLLPGPVSVKRLALLVASGLGPTIISVLIYLGCYLGFRYSHPSHYDATQLGGLNLGQAARVLWQYGFSTFPGYFYFQDPNQIALTFDGFLPRPSGLWQLVLNGEPEWLAKALIVAAFCALILLWRPSIFSRRSFAYGALGGLAGIIAPVFPVSLISKYQDWVSAHGSLAYSGPSYFAYYSMIFLLVTLIFGVNQLCAPVRILRFVFVALISSLAGTASVATDVYNHYVTIDQKLSHLKWRTIDRFLQTDEFKRVPDDSIIFAPSLWLYRGIVANGDSYWTNYLSQKSGKQIRVALTAQEFRAMVGPNGGKPSYFLRFEQEQKEPDQFVIFSPLDQRGRPMGGVVYSSEFSVFSYSKNKNFTLIGDCADTNRPIQVELNGHVVKDVTGNAFFGQVDLHNVEEDFPKVTVKATAPIDIAHLTVSYFPVAPGKRGVDVVYGPGFHGLEENAAAGLMWNWSRAESDVIFVSYANHPISASIQFSLSVLTARVIHIQINDTEESISFEAAGGKPVHLTGLILQPGENKMHLSSDRPAQPPGNGDPRLIAFGVQNLEVNEEK